MAADGWQVFHSLPGTAEFAGGALVAAPVADRVSGPDLICSDRLHCNLNTCPFAVSGSKVREMDELSSANAVREVGLCPELP